MLDDLRVRQLENALAPFQALRRVARPRQGWLKPVREALGMSLRQLSDRTGLSKTAVRAAETSEARETVQMDTLKNLANAMECDLVYALVPRGSIHTILDIQARRIAARSLGRVSESMELEAQAVERGEHLQQMDSLAAEIMRARGREFWDVWEGT